MPGFLAPFQLPAPFQPPPPLEEAPKKETRRKRNRGERHTTVTGRVVYDRKRHFFNLRDIRRILQNILTEDEGKPTDLATFYLDFFRVLELMRDIGLRYLNPQQAALIDDLVKVIRQTLNIKE